jgi:sugar phosphate isomerase/epimerase
MRQTASDLSRRSLLACGLATAGAALTPAAAMAADPFFKRVNLPIGIQLYTLGADLSKDLDGHLAALAQIGFRQVEIPGLLGRTPAELRAAFDRAGMVCPAAHVSGRGQPEWSFSGDLAKLADSLATIGVKTAVLPSHYAPDRFASGPAAGEAPADFTRRARAGMTADDWKMNADFLNQKAAVLKRSGIAVGYHNHAYEFAPIGNTNGLEILITNTDPALVTIELDVGWVAAAGVDPAAFFAKHKGRFGLMHVKDLQGPVQGNYENRMNPTELGSGVLDWAKILPAAYAAGVRGFYYEQEPPFARPRLEAVKISYDYITRVVA